MAGKGKAIGKCERCGIELPEIDETGQFNFQLVGERGDKRKVCGECNKLIKQSKPSSKGWSA